MHSILYAGCRILPANLCLEASLSSAQRKGISDRAQAIFNQRERIKKAIHNRRLFNRKLVTQYESTVEAEY
jgi:hypothetical protein